LIQFFEISGNLNLGLVNKKQKVTYFT